MEPFVACQADTLGAVHARGQDITVIVKAYRAFHFFFLLKEKRKECISFFYALDINTHMSTCQKNMGTAMTLSWMFNAPPTVAYIQNVGWPLMVVAIIVWLFIREWRGGYNNPVIQNEAILVYATHMYIKDMTDVELRASPIWSMLSTSAQESTSPQYMKKYFEDKVRDPFTQIYIATLDLKDDDIPSIITYLNRRIMYNVFVQVLFFGKYDALALFGIVSLLRQYMVKGALSSAGWWAPAKGCTWAPMGTGVWSIIGVVLFALSGLRIFLTFLSVYTSIVKQTKRMIMLKNAIANTPKVPGARDGTNVTGAGRI
jgi:hypothetical protein